MPTLLDLAGIEIPQTVVGRSMLSEKTRDALYAECNEGATASRMMHDGRFKLIYYPAGHRFQLFDLQDDPHELTDLSASRDHAAKREELTARLIGELYGSDLDWLKDGELVGRPEPEYQPQPNRGLSLQRGVHWPHPPVEIPTERDASLK